MAGTSVSGFEEKSFSLTHSIRHCGDVNDRKASDNRGQNFEACVWRKVSADSSDHLQEVSPSQFSIYLYKGVPKFHFLFLALLSVHVH